MTFMPLVDLNNAVTWLFAHRGLLCWRGRLLCWSGASWAGSVRRPGVAGLDLLHAGQGGRPLIQPMILAMRH